MRRVFYVALAVFTLQTLSSEAGFIKKLVTGVIGGSGDTDSAGPGSHHGFEQQTRPPPHSAAGSHDKHTHSYRNTSWHIENEDYLTPNQNESFQHQQKPSSGYGGGGTYDRKTTTAQPYKDAPFSDTWPDVREGMSQDVQQKVQQNYHDVGVDEAKNPTGGDGDDADVILQSDSITCCYSNARAEDVEKRRMRCNQKDCRLEKSFEKSSLWICEDIKCTVANVDFSRTDSSKKLMECSMDGRNIITVQDKPIKCGNNEKAHNGRCRQVFGK